MEWRVYTAAAVEPVTLAEAKAHLRVDGTTEDIYVLSLIAHARDIAERYCNKAFISRTVDVTLDESEMQGVIYLPLLPVATVSGVYYTDEDGAETEVTSSEYQADAVGGRVVLKDGGSWPDCRTFAGYRIRYVAGYGASAASVPGAVVRGIMQLISDLYENRLSDSDSAFAGTPLSVAARSLLDSDRRYLI